MNVIDREKEIKKLITEIPELSNANLKFVSSLVLQLLCRQRKEDQD